jgi:hypothetical protein
VFADIKEKKNVEAREKTSIFLIHFKWQLQLVPSNFPAATARQIPVAMGYLSRGFHFAAEIK